MKKMSFTEKIKLFFENIKQIKIDKRNREQFLIDIKQEILDPKSEFNKLGLQCNEDYTSISSIISIPENYQLASTDIMKYNKLVEGIQPINKYINTTLNWGEYFVFPEFYYIENVDDSSNDEDYEQNILEEISCSYIATWKYMPILSKYPNFKYEMAAFIGINSTVVLGIITTLLIVLL